MAYIIGLLVIALLFIALHYFTETTKQQKIFITVIFFLTVLGAIAFNSYTEYQRKNMLNIVMEFNQNKTVHCNGFDINNSNFTLSIGTYTFIGKENSQYFGEMVGVVECRSE